jgi:DNA-binding SARP family transcriptional activator
VILLRSLGTAEIDTGTTRLTPSQEVAFAAALYLVLQRGKRVSRVRLASLLWPSVPEKARGHRMRQTILQLKKLGIVVMADRDSVYVSKSDVRSDTDALSVEDHPSVLIPESLEFLPGYAPRLSESFRDWVELRRSDVHAAGTRILVHAIERHRLHADWVAVEKTAAKCLVLDAYNETAVLAQAEAAAMLGGKRKAVSILDRYVAELGSGQTNLQLPAALLRRRIVERVPERPALLNIDPPFVGREQETETLIKKFNEARAGHGSATLIVGEPGIGKSRLSAEVARFAELQGAQVQRAACRRADVDRPLSLFVDIVPQLREMPGALGCDPESLACLRRLTEFEERRQENSYPSDSDLNFQKLRTALFDLFDSVTEERCLALFVEDVQWIDKPSAKILIRLVERCASKHLFVVINSRRLSNEFLSYSEAGGAEIIALAPLKPAACTALLQSTALRPRDQPQSDFIDWCLQVAEGNPFFLQELAHHWIETGKRYEAPPSVAKVLEERLSRLSPEALQVLQTCSVLDDHSTLDRVERILKYQPHQLLSAVEELSMTAMLNTTVDTTDAIAGQLSARHDFLSAAAIRRLAPVSLAFIHRRAADVLEQEIAHATMPTTLLWACASHRHNAGDRSAALRLTISCAEHLLNNGLTEDSCKAFEKSLEYCLSEEQRLHVLPLLAAAYQLNGQWDKSKEALRSCISIAAGGDTDSNSHNEFELRLFAARYQTALDFSLLLPDIVKCVETKDASPAHRVRAAVMALKIATDFGPAEILDSIYDHVAPLLDRHDVEETERFEVAMIYGTIRNREAIPLAELRNYVAAVRDRGGDVAYSSALLTASAACRITARYHDGLAFVTEAFEHATVRKHNARLPHILIAEMRLHAAAGQFARAKETLDRLARYPVPCDDETITSEIRTYEARLAVENNDLDAASSALARVPVLAVYHSPRRRAHSLAISLHVRLNQMAPVEEIRTLASQLEMEHLRVRELGNHDFESYALYTGLSAIGQSDRAFALLKEYVEQRRRSDWPLPATIHKALYESPRSGLHRKSSSSRARPSGDFALSG